MPGGPGSFAPDSTSLVLLWRTLQRGPVPVAYGPVTLFGTTFLKTSARNGFVTPRCFRNPGTNPGLGYVRFRSPLLTESMSLSFPPGTKMFQFPGFASKRLYIQRWMIPIDRNRVSAFRNLRIDACLPASRSISQATTSFVASRCQGIHHTPLVA